MRRSDAATEREIVRLVLERERELDGLERLHVRDGQNGSRTPS